jgi:probable rRNA maturation factor
VIEVAVRAPAGASTDELVRVLRRGCERLGLERASVGLMVVDAAEMARINAAHRGPPEPTDVLAFPVDGPEALDDWPADGPPPELGDVVICPEAAEEPLATLAVHGLLHLLGHDHERDAGEMLALQDELVQELVG